MIYRIGPFQLELQSRELLREGERIPLTPKAFDLLLYFVENPQRVVSKDELFERIWPETTVSESTLSSTICSLRKALGEHPRSPHYVETVSKHGYRFIADLEAVELPVPSTPSRPEPRRSLWRPAALVMVGILGSVLFQLQVASDRRAAGAEDRADSVPLLRQKTDYQQESLARFDHLGVWPSISPDGLWIVFSEISSQGRGRDLSLMPSHGGATSVRLTHNPAWEFYPMWSPDSRRIAFWRDEHIDGKLAASNLVAIDAFGERREVNLLRLAQPFKIKHYLSWSKKGIFFTARRSSEDSGAIYLLDTESRQLQRIEIPDPEAPLDPEHATLSPDGQRIAFIAVDRRTQDLYFCPLQGGETRRLTFGYQYFAGLAWEPDGQGIIFASSTGHPDNQFQLWRVSIQGGEPERLPLGGYLPHLSQNGNLVYERAPLLQLISEVKIDAPVDFALERPVIQSAWSDYSPSYSPDGCGVAFTSTRRDRIEIWLSEIETGVERPFMQLSAAESPNWSHRGCRIAFALRNDADSHGDIYVTDLSGGPPVRLTSDPDPDTYPSWSRDGKWIYFSSLRGGEWQIWKVGVKGGPVVQLTSHGGLRPVEGPRGRFVYYQKAEEDGIWRIGVAGGEETLVVDRYKVWLNGYWALGKDRIYFVDGLRGRSYALYTHSLETGKVRHIADLEGLVANSSPGLTVSPDEHKLLLTMSKPTQSEIVLVRGWR